MRTHICPIISCSCECYNSVLQGEKKEQNLNYLITYAIDPYLHVVPASSREETALCVADEILRSRFRKTS